VEHKKDSLFGDGKAWVPNEQAKKVEEKVEKEFEVKKKRLMKIKIITIMKRRNIHIKRKNILMKKRILKKTLY